MTFQLARTEEGRTRATCTRCGLSQSSWSSRQVSQWQRAHECQPDRIRRAP